MMTNVKAFDSFEDAQAYMAEQEKIANENVLPMNREIEYGSHWWRYLADYDIFIFGEVFPENHTETWWEEKYGPYDKMPEDLQAERDFEMERIKSSYERGYRYGRCYSVVEPDGEIGSTHIVEMFPMSKTEFDKAKAENWDVRDPETGQLKPWFAVTYFRTRERFLKETKD